MCAAVDKLLFVGGAVARDWSEEREREVCLVFSRMRAVRVNDGRYGF